MAHAFVVDVEEEFPKYQFDGLLSLMDEERRKKILSFHFEVDRKRALLASALVLYLADRFHANGCKAAALRYNAYGKPYFSNDTLPFFNLSHSGRWVICVWSTREIGADVQEIKKIEQDIARRFFHPREYAFLVQRDEEEKQIQLFYQYWTLKESYIKYLGTGLSTPLDSFWFDIRDEEIKLHGDTVEEVNFFLYDLDMAHKMAVCTKDNTVDSVEQVSLREICARLYGAGGGVVIHEGGTGIGIGQ
jgi:4'-phosphopantetheinyl transferase